MIEAALQVFKTQYGHLDIPLDYKIEGREISLYESVAGIEGAPLGEMLADIKRRCLYFNTQDLKKRWRGALGISCIKDRNTRVLEDGRIVTNGSIYIDAITIFKQRYEHVMVPHTYRITEKECEFYPKHMHGMLLGILLGHDVHCIRSYANNVNATTRPHLEALGVLPPLNEVNSLISVSVIILCLTFSLC